MKKVNLLQLINFLNNIYEHKKTANPNGLAVFFVGYCYYANSFSIFSL